MPVSLLPGCILLAIVGNGLGFLFLRWPQAGAKTFQVFRGRSRWFSLVPFPINVWTARLFGIEMAIGGLASTAAVVYIIVEMASGVVR